MFPKRVPNIRFSKYSPLFNNSQRTIADRSFRLANVTDLYAAQKYKQSIGPLPWLYTTSDVKTRDISKQLVIDLSHEQGYRRGHIPGAVNLSVEKFDFTRKVDAYGGITRDEIYNLMKSLGLSNDTSEIVLYDNSALLACRMWFVLRYFGFRNVRVLNGGWRAWLRSGLPVDENSTVLKPGSSLDLKPKRTYVLTTPTQMVFDVEHKTSKYVDSRSPSAYKEYHINGAVNVPSTDLMDDAIFKSVDDIRKRVASSGVDLEVDKVICYSGQGLSSAVNVFALLMVGVDKVSLYDAGISNWKQNFDSKLSGDAEDFLKH